MTNFQRHREWALWELEALARDHPELRLGQLIITSIGEADLSTITDEQLAADLEVNRKKAAAPEEEMTKEEFRSICFQAEMDNRMDIGTPVDRGDDTIHIRGELSFESFERLYMAWREYKGYPPLTTGSTGDRHE